MEINTSADVQQKTIKENGLYPNNYKLPYILYKAVFRDETNLTANDMTELFAKNGWTNSWTNGIYSYHHYHSITHEVIGVFSGNCKVALGGDDSNTVMLKKGDVLVIPVGVAHKNIESSKDFGCVGAYPGGKDYDIKKGNEKDKEEALSNMQDVSVPETDPVYGKAGLADMWKQV